MRHAPYACSPSVVLVRIFLTGERPEYVPCVTQSDVQSARIDLTALSLAREILSRPILDIIWIVQPSFYTSDMQFYITKKLLNFFSVSRRREQKHLVMKRKQMLGKRIKCFCNLSKLIAMSLNPLVHEHARSTILLLSL